MTLLWHGEKPVGICVFSLGPLALSQRNKFFGLKGSYDRLRQRALNRQLVMLSRVVLHPAYRGAGIAALFVRRSCEMCPRPWIETQAQMGWINPFFEKAGFVRVGHVAAKDRPRAAHSGIYGGCKRHGQETLVSKETHDKSRFAEPVYYIFDNRQQFRRQRTERTGR